MLPNKIKLAFLIIIASLLLNLNKVVAENTEREEIILGATLPLSGDYASYGQAIKDGCELAVRDLNKQNMNVKVVYEDVPSPNKTAVTAIRKLIEHNKIKGLVGNFWNGVIPIIDAEITRANIPVFHTATADDLILDSKGEVFSTNHKLKDEANEIANYLFNKVLARRVSVLYIGTTFGEQYSKHFSKKFSELGGEILNNDVTLLGDNDFRAVLSKVKSKNPDALFLAYFGTNLGLVLKQAKQNGISCPIISVYEAEDKTVIENAGQYAEGLKYFISEPKELQNNERLIANEFQKDFGYEPNIFTKNAYDATMILVKTLRACKLDSNCAKKKIYTIKNYPGFSGNFSIDTDGGAKKEFVLKEIREGRFLTAQR